MQASNMDLLLHLGQKSYDVLTLDMRDGFNGQAKTWDTVVPADVLPVLARLEALNTKQGHPGIFSGCGYRDGWSYVHGFRTRDGLVGYYQIRGVEDLDGRGVEIRCKLVPQQLSAPTAAPASATPQPEAPLKPIPPRALFLLERMEALQNSMPNLNGKSFEAMQNLNLKALRRPVPDNPFTRKLPLSLSPRRGPPAIATHAEGLGGQKRQT
jgi:hypothetical protein